MIVGEKLIGVYIRKLVEFIQVFNITNVAGVNKIRSHAGIGPGVVLAFVKAGKQHIGTPQQDTCQNQQENHCIFIKTAGKFQVKEKSGISQKQAGENQHFCVMGAVKKAGALCGGSDKAGQDDREEQGKGGL